MGLKIRAAAVVLTAGTFLGGRIHVGLASYAGGRAGDPPANALSRRLRELRFRVRRLKTGTPPRIDGRSIDYSGLVRQPGDEPVLFQFQADYPANPPQIYLRNDFNRSLPHIWYVQEVSVLPSNRCRARTVRSPSV